MSAVVADVVAVRVPERTWRSEARAVKTVWRRDLIRFLGNRGQTMTWLVQPLLFLFVLASGLQSLSAGSTGGVDLKTFMFPGVLCIAVLFTARASERHVRSGTPTATTSAMTALIASPPPSRASWPG